MTAQISMIKGSKDSPASKTIHLITETETTPVNKKKQRRRYHKGRTTKGIITHSDLVVKVSSINFALLITISVPRAMFTHFLVEHGLSQYYLYGIDLPGGSIT